MIDMFFVGYFLKYLLIQIVFYVCLSLVLACSPVIIYYIFFPKGRKEWREEREFTKRIRKR